MDRKQEENNFDNLWKSYLDLEKEIHEKAARLEEDSSEILREMLYNLCNIAISMNHSLEFQASALLDSAVLSNFENACRIKREDLFEIASKITKSRSK